MVGLHGPDELRSDALIYLLVHLLVDFVLNFFLDFAIDLLVHVSSHSYVEPICAP